MKAAGSWCKISMGKKECLQCGSELVMVFHSSQPLIPRTTGGHRTQIGDAAPAGRPLPQSNFEQTNVRARKQSELVGSRLFWFNVMLGFFLYFPVYGQTCFRCKAFSFVLGHAVGIIQNASGGELVGLLFRHGD